MFEWFIIRSVSGKLKLYFYCFDDDGEPIWTFSYKKAASIHRDDLEDIEEQLKYYSLIIEGIA